MIAETNQSKAQFIRPRERGYHQSKNQMGWDHSRTQGGNQKELESAGDQVLREQVSSAMIFTARGSYGLCFQGQYRQGRKGFKGSSTMDRPTG
jgi:hypothetical protein